MKRVAVLKGGRSLERQVSLKSGARVQDALERLGHQVIPIDVGADLVDRLSAERPEIAFVALHGSWNRAERTGYKVVRLLFDNAGKPTGEYEDFMTGFVISDKQVWGRPVGVAVAKDGSLFVTEDGNGTIWRVSR